MRTHTALSPLAPDRWSRPHLGSSAWAPRRGSVAREEEHVRTSSQHRRQGHAGEAGHAYTAPGGSFYERFPAQASVTGSSRLVPGEENE